MVLIRNLPQAHNIGGVILHPGAQFIDDLVYHNQLKKDPGFQGQLKSFMEIVVPAIAEDKLKDRKNPPKCLAEELEKIDERQAIAIIQKTVDILDIEEIARYDKRRLVVAAANDQREQRAGVLNSLAPKISASDGKSARLPGFEEAREYIPGAK